MPRGRKIAPRHHPEAPRHHFDVLRGRFAYQLEQRQTTVHDLKARGDRWRMIIERLTLTASRAKTIPRRLNPIDAHMRATRRRFTPSAAHANPTRDHFTQRNRQREVVADDINVVEQGHLPTSMQPLVMPRDAFLFRPQPTHHATAGRDRRASFHAPRCSRTRSTRPRPPSPRHAPCTRAPQNPAVRAGNGRAAAPARASGGVHRERPAHPSRRVGKCDAIRTLPPSPRHAPCKLAPR